MGWFKDTESETHREFTKTPRRRSYQKHYTKSAVRARRASTRRRWGKRAATTLGVAALGAAAYYGNQYAAQKKDTLMKHFHEQRRNTPMNKHMGTEKMGSHIVVYNPKQTEETMGSHMVVYNPKHNANKR